MSFKLIFFLFLLGISAVEVCLKCSSTARHEDVRVAVERFVFACCFACSNGMLILVKASGFIRIRLFILFLKHFILLPLRWYGADMFHNGCLDEVV